MKGADVDVLNFPIPLIPQKSSLEREVSPHVRMVEGSFGEYLGYEAGNLHRSRSSRSTRYLSKRSHFAFLNMGMPVHEGQTATALIKGLR